MSTEHGKTDNGAAAPLSTVIDNLKRSNIGTEIKGVYAVIDPDHAEFSAFAGDVAEITPLATGANYLLVAIGEVDAKAGIYFPERKEAEGGGRKAEKRVTDVAAAAAGSAVK